MLLKENVSIKRNGDGKCCLDMDGREVMIENEHIPIMEAIRNGCTDNEALAVYIMKAEKCSRAAAGFILADCILLYSDYIQEDNSCYMIE